MANDKVVHVSDSEFENKVLANQLPCLVDFWAPWCGPCKSIGPVVEELTAEYDGRAVIAKMNVDDNPTNVSFKTPEEVKDIIRQEIDSYKLDIKAKKSKKAKL